MVEVTGAPDRRVVITCSLDEAHLLRYLMGRCGGRFAANLYGELCDATDNAHDRVAAYNVQAMLRAGERWTPYLNTDQFLRDLREDNACVA